MMTPRLLSIVKEAGKCHTVADIGTDHAYVPIEMLIKGKCEYAIASDLNEGPLRIAKENVCEHNLEDAVSLRLGGGLSVIDEGEADTVIIAGMGGEIIEEIIRNDIKKARAQKLILQPMNSQYELRKFLIKNGFSITKEELSVEGFKVYNILTVDDGCCAEYENEFYYQLPPSLYTHKYFRVLYEKKKREFLKITKGLEAAKDKDTEKYELYSYFLKELEKL